MHAGFPASIAPVPPDSRHCPALWHTRGIARQPVHVGDFSFGSKAKLLGKHILFQLRKRIGNPGPPERAKTPRLWPVEYPCPSFLFPDPTVSRALALFRGAQRAPRVGKGTPRPCELPPRLGTVAPYLSNGAPFWNDSKRGMRCTLRKTPDYATSSILAFTAASISSKSVASALRTSFAASRPCASWLPL